MIRGIVLEILTVTSPHLFNSKLGGEGGGGGAAIVANVNPETA